MPLKFNFDVNKNYAILSMFYSAHLHNRSNIIDKVQSYFETNIVNITVSALFIKNKMTTFKNYINKY